MRAKRIVVMAALVALLSGGAVMAADSRTAEKTGPTVKVGEDVFRDGVDGYKVARFRGRWDQVRYSPPDYGEQPIETCSDNPLTRIVARLFGVDEIMRNCTSGR